MTLSKGKQVNVSLIQTKWSSSWGPNCITCHWCITSLTLQCFSLLCAVAAPHLPSAGSKVKALLKQLLVTGLWWLGAASTHLAGALQKHQQSMGLYVITPSVLPGLSPRAFPVTGWQTAKATWTTPVLSSDSFAPHCWGRVPLADVCPFTIKREKIKKGSLLPQQSFRELRDLSQHWLLHDLSKLK